MSVAVGPVTLHQVHSKSQAGQTDQPGSRRTTDRRTLGRTAGRTGSSAGVTPHRLDHTTCPAFPLLLPSHLTTELKPLYTLRTTTTAQMTTAAAQGGKDELKALLGLMTSSVEAILAANEHLPSLSSTSPVPIAHTKALAVTLAAGSQIKAILEGPTYPVGLSLMVGLVFRQRPATAAGPSSAEHTVSYLRQLADASEPILMRPFYKPGRRFTCRRACAWQLRRTWLRRSGRRTRASGACT